MTNRGETEGANSSLSQEDILSVYQQLGLTAATDRAYYAALDPRPAPPVHLTVRIGSTSLPQI